MKRLLALVGIVFTVMLFANGITAYAMQSDDIEPTKIGNSNIYYQYCSDTKTLTITGTGDTVNFTNSSNGSSSQPWFEWRADGSIEKIVIGEGITAIGNYFFYGVSAADIELPSTLTRIGSYAFACNNRLDGIDLKSITSMSNNAFYDCSSLEKIYLPDTLTFIGVSAFESCNSLSSVEFAKMSMKITVSARAFLNCPSLRCIDVPRYATLGVYSLGFERAVNGAIKEDFSIGVFRDSKAYSYSQRNNLMLERRLLESMVIYDGDNLTCAYYEDSLNEKIKYYFTPNVSCQYNFYSVGDVDVDCTLTDSEGNVVAVCTDASEDDHNFSISCVLSAGETYCYTVESAYSTGEYELHLSPGGYTGVSIDWNISIKSESLIDAQVDIGGIISGLDVDFAFESGYVYHMPFEEGASYMGLPLHYLNELGNELHCGDNVDYISIGSQRLEFHINVIHCYTMTVVEPTLKNYGYTRYKCDYCGYIYDCDYVEYLGVSVYGYLRVLDSPNGSAIQDSFVPYAMIYDSEGNLISSSDSNGFFYVEYAYDYFTIVTPLENELRVYVKKGDFDLGDIPVLMCDIYPDHYINAKDVAILNMFKGEYEEDDYIMKSFDLNNNGVIDSGDWEYMQSFYSYGKLDERIYDN